MDATDSDVAVNTGEGASVSSRDFYQCGVCKKVYARADHLIRHVRSRMIPQK